MRKPALVLVVVPFLIAACVSKRVATSSVPENDVGHAPADTDLPPAPVTPTTAAGEPEPEATPKDGPAPTVVAKVAAAPKPAPTAAASAFSDALEARSPALLHDLSGGGSDDRDRGGGLGSLGGAPMAPSSRSAYGAYASPAASIAAGEWNDNANYREFQKWLGTEAGVPYRHVDVSHRRFLVVRDEAGKAIPSCRIDVSDDQEKHVSFLTGPSGRALFFPRAEGFGEGAATATASCDGGSVTRSVSLDDSDGVIDLKLPVSRSLPAMRTIDVAFILDTTGSMSEEIASVKSTIAKVTAGLGQKDIEVRIGLVEYKDRGDAFVTRVYPFTGDVKGFAGKVAGLSASGGGDTPESVNEGIHVALTGLDWQSASVGRFAFLIGDAPPHLDYQQDFSYAADMKNAAHRGIQIFTIAASGMDGLGQVVFRQIAQYTNAENMFVLRGGAGPQSVGGGDPKSSCGGTHANYSSGNLDALILGKIGGELHALEGDPMRIAGLHEDENVKPCDQRVVMQ